VSGVEEIDISNNRTTFYAGEEYQFSAIILPLNIISSSPKFLIVNPFHRLYLNISSDGYGIFNVSVPDFDLIAIEISVYCDNKLSSILITLINPIHSIVLDVISEENSYNPGYQYLEDLNIYIIDPDIEIALSVDYINLIPTRLVRFHSYQIILNSVAKEYFTFDEESLIFKTKSNSLPGGEYAMISLLSENIMSNTLIFYIPIAIRTLNDYKGITNNIFGYYALYEDIDFQNTFFQIPEFHGILIGNHHLLKNITLEQIKNHGVIALFSENYGVIRSLVVDNFNLTISNNQPADGILLVGSVLCGINYGLIDNCEVHNLSNSHVTIEADNMIFGVISGINYGIINKSYSEIRVYFRGLLAGGVVGINSSQNNEVSGLITNCRDFTYFYMKKGSTSGVYGTNQGQIINSSYSGRVWE
jgi:hypothetical protein